MNPQSIYCKTIKTKLKHFANWFPNNELALGDFGIIKNYQFHKLGNIKNMFNIEFDPHYFNNRLVLNYSENSEIKFGIEAKGDIDQVANVDVSVNINKANELFFNSVIVRSEAIDAIYSLTEPVLALGNKWEKEFVIITYLCYSKNTVAAISDSNQSSLKLACTSPLMAELKTDLDAQFKVSYKKNSNFTYTSDSEITPVMKVARLKKKWFKKESVRPYESFIEGEHLPEDYESSDDYVYELEEVEDN